jgi:hypothetical protein
LSYKDGLVDAIRSEPPGVDVFVSGMQVVDYSVQRFSFPLNAAEFAAEFKRAQNEDRAVTVGSKPSAAQIRLSSCGCTLAMPIRDPMNASRSRCFPPERQGLSQCNATQHDR